MPNFLVGLTGVSAGAYGTKKVAERAKPILTSVIPSKARVNDVVDVWGQNLVTDPGSPVVSATVGGLTAGATVVASPGGSDHLQVTVPAGVPTGQQTQLAVYNAVGTSADPPLPFEVLP
jgi:hypothetical protein